MKVTSEMYKNILDILTMGITVIDKENTIIVMNRLFGEMLQKDPEQLVGTSVMLCHPLESRTAVENLIRDLKTGVKKNYETWLNFRGRILYEQMYPMWDDRGNYLGIVDMLLDVSDKAEYMKRLGLWKELPVKGLKKESSIG